MSDPSTAANEPGPAPIPAGPPARWRFSHALVALHGLSYLVPIVLDAVGWGTLDVDGGSLHLSAPCASALALAHLNLLGVTFALGDCDRRHVLLIVAAATSYAGFSAVRHGEFWPLAALMIGAQVVLAIAAFPAMAVTLTFRRQQLERRGANDPIAPWQFSLRHLFLATTGIACLLGVVRLQFWQMSPAEFRHSGLVHGIVLFIATIALVIGGGVAAMLLLAILPVGLAFRSPWPGLGVLFHAVLLATVLAATSMSLGNPTTATWLIAGAFAVIYALATTGTLWIYRRAGFRLVPTPPSTTEEKTE